MFSNYVFRRIGHHVGSLTGAPTVTDCLPRRRVSIRIYIHHTQLGRIETRDLRSGASNYLFNRSGLACGFPDVLPEARDQVGSIW
jgi:hypothetical protein